MIVFEDKEGPQIYQVDILPRAPKAGDDLFFVIYCIDRSGVVGAQLHFSKNDDEWKAQNMTFYTCLCIAGGRWVGVVTGLQAGDRVQLYATAIDGTLSRNIANTQVFTVEVRT